MSNFTEQRFILACNLWEEGDFRKAFELFSDLAISGNAGAQLNLGVMYESGEGVVTDLEKAMFWYKKSWEQERSAAVCLNLSDLYQKLDYSAQSNYWIEKAIELGDDEAKLILAKKILSEKYGNINEAKKLLEKAISSSFITEDSRSEAKEMLLSLDPDNLKH